MDKQPTMALLQNFNFYGCYELAHNLGRLFASWHPFEFAVASCHLLSSAPGGRIGFFIVVIPLDACNGDDPSAL